MLRLHGIVGRETDHDVHARLHALEHRNAVELLFVPEAEARRRRFRLTTDKGTDCAVSLDRGEELSDGSVLLIAEQRAVVVRLGAPKRWCLRPNSPDAALRLGWNAGNLHWRVSFEEGGLVVLLDAPLEAYRARIARLLSDGLVEEVAT